MKRDAMKNVILLPIAVLAAVLLGSGCMVFNVGKPDVFVHEENAGETATLVPGTQREIVDVQAIVEQRERTALLDFDVHVELKATQRGTFDIRHTKKTYTVRRQRRLAVGFYPGAAEYYLMPEGALVPCNADYACYKGDVEFGHKPGQYKSDPTDRMEGFWMGVMSSWVLFPIGIIETANSLVIAPLRGWDCTHDLVPAKGGFGTNLVGWHVELTPEIQALSKFSSRERARMGVQSVAGRHHGGIAAGWPFGHLGLFGVHKHLAVFVDEPAVTQETTRETRTETFGAYGPCYAELSVPALNNHVQRKRLTGSMETSFRLPDVDRDCTVTAYVSFLADPEDSTPPDRLHHKVLAKARGRKWSGVLRLKASPNATASPRSQPGIVVTNVVVVDRRTPTEPKYRVYDEEPYANGRAVYRVELLGGTTLHEVEDELRAMFEGNVRRAFVKANPGVDEASVRVNAMERYDGDVVRFEVRAYALPPEVEPIGYEYSQETRSGTMRFRVAERARANMAKVKAWARENIAAVVTDKNVLLTAGERPPEGATFRSLDENFSDGVLTVEFEAVQ